MDSTSADPVITWLILVYDRTATERFPLKRKWLRFNYERASEEEVREVLRLVWQRREDDLPTPDLELGERHVSISIDGSEFTDRRILEYRHLFDHVPDEKKLHTDEDRNRGFTSVSLPPMSYFEDEEGVSISQNQMFDAEAELEGGEGVISIRLDDPESILRCGPATPVRRELWTEADAELVAQLEAAYGHLSQSRWLRSRCAVSPVSEDECHAILPVHEDCLAVILPFRQLYSKDGIDDLFNRCCKLHNRHCPPEHPTHSWVEHYRERFNTILDEPVRLMNVDSDLSAKRWLDAFAYGARVVHATSKTDAPANDLKALLGSHPREMVVLGYHYVLRQLLSCTWMAIGVIHQNVDHWTKDLGWVGSSSLGGKDLFDA